MKVIIWRPWCPFSLLKQGCSPWGITQSFVPSWFTTNAPNHPTSVTCSSPLLPSRHPTTQGHIVGYLLSTHRGLRVPDDDPNALTRHIWEHSIIKRCLTSCLGISYELGRLRSLSRFRVLTRWSWILSILRGSSKTAVVPLLYHNNYKLHTINYCRFQSYRHTVEWANISTYPNFQAPTKRWLTSSTVWRFPRPGTGYLWMILLQVVKFTSLKSFANFPLLLFDFHPVFFKIFGEPFFLSWTFRRCRHSYHHSQFHSPILLFISFISSSPCGLGSNKSHFTATLITFIEFLIKLHHSDRKFTYNKI